MEILAHFLGLQASWHLCLGVLFKVSLTCCCMSSYTLLFVDSKESFGFVPSRSGVKLLARLLLFIYALMVHQISRRDCRKRFLMAHLFQRLSRDGHSYGSGTLRAMTASPKPSFRASRRLGDVVISRGSAGWTTQKSGHPCLPQNCLWWPRVKRTGRGSLLNSS